MDKKSEIISKDLLEILICPACKSKIELSNYEENKFGLECERCKCIYPIQEGIPIMLIDEAIKK